MKSRVVYFAHGKDSGPWGEKITRLAEIAKHKGFHVESPDYSKTDNPDKRVKMLLDLKPQAEYFLVLVGSSMGAYVSTVASEKLKPAGLFLMAPAFYLEGYADQNPKPYAALVYAIHGWADNVVPVSNSVRFAMQHRAQLHVLNSDHRLTSALPIIEKLFAQFLDQITDTEA